MFLKRLKNKTLKAQSLCSRLGSGRVEISKYGKPQNKTYEEN
ncbi:MAG: hypothetical protein QW385_00400 [Thermoproteota archaeon]